MSNKDHKISNQPVAKGPIGGGNHTMGTGEKSKDFKGTMSKLVNYIRAYWLRVIVVIIFAILSTVFTIISPKILGKMTNQIVADYIDITAYNQIIKQLPDGTILPAGTTGAQILSSMPTSAIEKIPATVLDRVKNLDLTQKPTFDYDYLGYIALWLLALYLLSSLFSYIQGWIMTDITQKIAYQLRKDISVKINRLPLKYFDTKPFGDVLSRVTNDVETISQTLNQSLSQLVTAITTIIGIAIMMFTISWQMTLVAFLVLPLSFFIIAIVVKKSQKFFASQQKSLGEINGHVEEMFSGHKIVKVFNGEAKSISRFNSINDDLYDSAWKSQFLSGLMMPIMLFIGNLGYVGVAVTGGWLAVKGTVNIGDIQAFIQYVRQFNQPISQTATIANVLQSTAAAAERVFEFLGEEEEIAETSQPISLKNIKGRVDFKDVVFGYNPDKTVIHNFSATINPGQRVAIVGPTGAGKTTLVNLLMRFYDINKGQITIDGVDIREFKRSDLRRAFGMVLQDTWLFNGTIRDNIAYGKPDATKKEIADAAKAAHADHFIHALPNGYDLEINEEADNISQGEKQLLTIARALLADAPIMILDEATSSVDTRTEVLIQKAMDNLMKNRTSFIIAHRLSTIRDADLILVIKDGNIIEQGKHMELLKNKGFYASLYNSQFANQA